MFTGKLDLDVQPIAAWSIVEFFVFVISVEHLMLLMKIFIEYMIPEVPDFVKEGEADRNIIS